MLTMIINKEKSCIYEHLTVNHGFKLLTYIIQYAQNTTTQYSVKNLK